MATFVPTTPLLVSDQAVALLAKTVVETAPGVFALNIVGGGGGGGGGGIEIPPFSFDRFNNSSLSKFTRYAGYYRYIQSSIRSPETTYNLAIFGDKNQFITLYATYKYDATNTDADYYYIEPLPINLYLGDVLVYSTKALSVTLLNCVPIGLPSI